MSAQLDDVVHELDRAIKALNYVRWNIGTLHALSFEVSTAGGDGGRTARQDHYYGDEAGNPAARREYSRLAAWLGLAKDRAVRDSLHPLVAISVGIERTVEVGTVDTRLGGSTITHCEYQQQLRLQAKRGSGGDRHVDQPKHPDAPK